MNALRFRYKTRTFARFDASPAATVTRACTQRNRRAYNGTCRIFDGIPTRCVMRLFYLCFCLVASLWLAQASANTTVAVSAVAPTALTPAQSAQPPAIALSQLGSQIGAPALTIRENLPRALSIERIASEQALFTQTFDPSIAYALGKQSATWLHFRVLADDQPSPTGWTLELPKPYMDRVEFYQKDARDAWQMQAAGDHIAHAQWPLQGLNPQFALPVMAAGVHDFYLKIQGEVPLHFSVHLQRTDAANARTQNRFLLGGLLLGVSALMLAFSGMLAFNAKHKEYLWYALFVGLSCLATATNMGLGNYALWPHAAVWPEYSSYCLVMVAIVAQLQFCRSMFLPRQEKSCWHVVLSTAMATNIATIGLYLYCDNAVYRQILYAFVNSLCIFLAMVLVVRALLQGHRAAWLWLLAYIPLIICVSLASADSFGFATNGIPYDAPVYAMLFEAVVLLAALHLHAKSQQAHHVRSSVLDSIDPHTGFVASRVYTATAQAMWDKARQNQRDVTVAYIEATSDAALSEQPIVRLLRTVTRDDDTVAHVDKNLYAILMPGQLVGTDLTNRLSRLVALGRMAVKDLAAGSSVQFRIVASSNAAFAGTWPQLDASLRNKLDDPKGWSRKSIRYVRLRSADDSQPESELASLSQLWQAAIEESARINAVKP
jgi:two-component system, sensor histidine kinase LadS